MLSHAYACAMAFQKEKLLFDYDGAAEALSLTRAALRDLVYRGRGPRVTKIGRRTFFARRDLEDFVAAHRAALKPHCAPADQLKRRKRGRPSIAEIMRG